MLKIYIARHGQDEDNANGILNGHRDTKLTAIGEQQALDLALAINSARLKFDAIYSSPLQRARTTAGIIICEIESDVWMQWEPNPLLIGRDFGVMTGKPVKDICSLCEPDVIKTETITYFLSPEGAETFPQLMDRAKLLLAEIRAIRSDGNVLLVTHGDMGKMIFASYYGLEWRDVLTMFHFGNSELLLLSEDCKPEEAHLVRIKQFNH
ncbi:MAG: histidine phosphatase family protein [Patescibacteria group bacterium]